MSNCARIQSIIDQADRPDLIPHEAASHMSGCRECRSFADQRTKLHELMGLTGRVTAPVNFNALLNERLSRVKSQKSPWLNSRGFVRLGTATAGLAVALLAAQYSGLLSSKPGKTELTASVTTDAPDSSEKGTQSALPDQRETEITPVRPGNTDGRGKVAVRAPQQSQGRGIPIFIVRDRDRDVEVPMLPVSYGMQQQVLNSSGRQQPRSSDISY